MGTRRKRSVIFALLAFFGATAGAVALAGDLTPDDFVLLQRCLSCIDNGCSASGTPLPIARLDEPMSLGSGRNVNTVTHGKVVAYPEVTVRNEHTGQDGFKFDVDPDVMILGLSPPPLRRAGGVKQPGFWVYVKGTSYFCPTAQIGAVWDGSTMGSPFRLKLPGMFKERGLRLRRYPADNSLAEVWGMSDKELKSWMPTVNCVADADAKEKEARNNPYFALADLLRFGVLDAGLQSCKHWMPGSRTAFEHRVRQACLNSKMPYITSLRKDVLQALEYTDKALWPDDCCEQVLWDRFIRRYGTKGLKEGAKRPECVRPPAPAAAEAPVEKKPDRDVWKIITE
ncbi:MAG: hypothetical protein HY075_15400 [Deltaproteobacteria bacterium]|nr:hypothetical protein [Deltaproteobacteria bacterium]